MDVLLGWPPSEKIPSRPEIHFFSASTPHLRSKAQEDVLNREPKPVEPPSMRISEYFGANVFNEEAMRMFLTEEA